MPPKQEGKAIITDDLSTGFMSICPCAGIDSRSLRLMKFDVARAVLNTDRILVQCRKLQAGQVPDVPRDRGRYERRG